MTTEQKEDTEIKGPFGWSFKSSDRYTTLFVLIIVCTALVAGFLFKHDADAANLSRDIALQTHMDAVKAANEVKKVAEAQHKQQETLEEMVWILSLTMEERKKYKLDMPVSMRRKLLDRERQ